LLLKAAERVCRFAKFIAYRGKKVTE
jgi:hypothetical protein